MFTNLKLGAKIALGFAALILIALFLGGLAVFNMNSVKTDAQNLATEYVPEVAVASQVQVLSLQIVDNVRAYGYNYEDNYRTAGQKGLEDLTKTLEEALQLANRSKILQELKVHAEKALKYTNEYKELFARTQTLVQEIQTARARLSSAATVYMDNCHSYLAGQNLAMGREIAARSATAERMEKITLIKDLIDLGNALRTANYQAQALRDPAILVSEKENFTKREQILQRLLSITREQVNIEQLNQINTAANTYLAQLEELLKSWTELQNLEELRNKAAEQVVQAAAVTASRGLENTQNISTQAAERLSTSSTIMVIGLIVALLVGVFLAYFITMGITGPVKKVIDGLTEGAEQVTAAAGQVSSASQQLAEGASEQASSLEEVSSTLEEMSSMTKQNAANARQANAMVADTGTAADQSKISMDRMSQAINTIKNSSDQTAKIVKNIDEIAFQTNLLALNAAVEAARAGEAGKGFAVVAEEVRNLAQRAAAAAKDTSALIVESQNSANNGVTVANEVAAILDRIVNSVKKVGQLINEVAAASDEQAQGIEQVNNAVAQMDQVTQSNSASAEESASASEELAAQAEGLNQMVDQLLGIVEGAGAVRQSKASLSVQSEQKPKGKPPVVAAKKKAAVNQSQFQSL